MNAKTIRKRSRPRHVVTIEVAVGREPSRIAQLIYAALAARRAARRARGAMLLAQLD